MTIKLTRQLLLSSILAAMAAGPVVATPFNQGTPGPSGEQATGSINHLGMSRSGLYVLFPNDFGTSNRGIYVRNFYNFLTMPVAQNLTGLDMNFYAISPNGRYVSYASNGSRVVRDQSTLTSVTIPAVADSNGVNVGLSNNGFVLFNKTVGSATQLVRLNLNNQSEVIVSPTVGTLGSHYRRNPLSADGQVALFQSAGQYKVYDATQAQSMAFAPVWNGVTLPIGAIDLASSGKYVAFASTNASDNHFLFRAALQSNRYGLERFDITAKKVAVDAGDGFSVSADGRYISFSGMLEEGHPDFAAAMAVGSPGFHRIFRYDTRSNELVTASVANNGGPIVGVSGTPLVNGTSIISDDGSLVSFATNALNLLPTPVSPSVGGEQNYIAFLGNGYARNFEFVEMPNSDNGFKFYEPMRLVADHQWEGTITFDGLLAPESFRFSANGIMSNGVPTLGGRSFGAASGSQSQASGQAVLNGTSFSIAGGAGTYSVSFNDETLQYSFRKQDWKRTVIFIQGQTIDGQDMFIRGGIDHAYALNNLGLNCAANNSLCAIPIRARNTLNSYTANWKIGDNLLDWSSAEVTQTLGNIRGLAQGTPLDWTTNNASNINKVAINGVGYTPLNTWGDHYWMLDVDVDCSKTVNGWFELKSFISGGPGWEPNITQVGAPYSSGNHFARCGQLNRFQRGNNSVLTMPIP